MAGQTSSEQGKRYIEFIERQLDLEYTRRAAIEQRAVGVLTTTGAFTSVLFAVVAISRGRDATLPTSVQHLVVAAVVMLVVTSLCALWATSLIRYTVTDVATLKQMIRAPHWADDEVDARNATAVSQVRSIESLRAGNDRKATRLGAAISCQAIAFTLIAAAVISAL